MCLNKCHGCFFVSIPVGVVVDDPVAEALRRIDQPDLEVVCILASALAAKTSLAFTPKCT